jgi:hypothetical protein
VKKNPCLENVPFLKTELAKKHISLCGHCLACDDQIIQCSNRQGEHQKSDVFIPIATFGIVHTTFNCNKERGSCHSIHTKIDPSGSIFFDVISAFV